MGAVDLGAPDKVVKKLFVAYKRPATPAAGRCQTYRPAKIEIFVMNYHTIFYHTNFRFEHFTDKTIEAFYKT